MPMFRKKPVVIEARQFTGENEDDLFEWLDESDTCASSRDDPDGRRLFVVSTLEGEMVANPGDWIICGVRGEFYPCKPDIFDATYEAA